MPDSEQETQRRGDRRRRKWLCADIHCSFTLLRSPRLRASCSIRCGFSLDVVGPAEPRAEKGPTRNAAEPEFSYLLRGIAPAALRACPHGLGRGSGSSASPPHPWADGLRPFYPPTTTRAPAPSHRDGAPGLSSYGQGTIKSHLHATQYREVLIKAYVHEVVHCHRRRHHLICSSA